MITVEWIGRRNGMSLFQTLLDEYGYNEPIMSSNIAFKGYSRPWIYKELSKLCDDGSLIRFEKGIYYIPKQTILGPSLLDPQKIIEKKYIKNGTQVMGYYSGSTLLYQLDLSTQIPNTIELYTNNEPTRSRNITVGTQKVILKKSRTEINASNAAVLSFLELMNSMPPSFFDEFRKQRIDEYIQKANISRKDITKYASVFPDRAMRTLVESEVIYSVTQ